MPDRPTNPDSPEALKIREARWKLRLTQADFWQKVLISFLGAIVVGVFYLWQASQSESHYYADLQSEREKADNELRGSMFKTLVDAYLKRQPDDGKQAPRVDAQAALLNSIEQDILLSDLLARNFETIDIRPLFEDLDHRLATLQYGINEKTATEDQKRAFLLRERLRRVARGTTARQRALLQTAGSQTFLADVESCRSGDGTSDIDVKIRRELTAKTESSWSKFATFWYSTSDSGADFKDAPAKQTGDQGKPAKPSRRSAIFYSAARDAGDFVEVRGIRDGTVEVKGPYSATASQAVGSTFWITYYDMPLLETVRSEGRERISFGVVRYVSELTCRLLQWDESLSDGERQELKEFCESRIRDGKTCELAEVAVTILPPDFIASRDRPYLDQLAKRQRDSGINVIVTALFVIVAAALLGFVGYVLWHRLAQRFGAKRGRERS